MQKYLGLLALAAVLGGACAPDRVAFRGDHQAGIATPIQKFAFVAAFDVTATDPADLKALLKTWTNEAEALSQGLPVGTGDHASAPPADTGEVRAGSPARLTLTFGAGPSLFDGRFGLADRLPANLKPLPRFNGDQLNPEASDGDLVIQVASDEYAVAFHALHQLARAARGTATLRWVQQGFSAPRNLQGFNDGTENPDVGNPDDLKRVVWADDSQGWMAGGSYLVVRKIRMLVENWDRTAIADQERTIGRSRDAGDILKNEDEDAHRKLARGDNTQKILRRPFSYVNGPDGRTGQWDAGLLFLAWMKDPQAQFVPIQSRLAASDRLNEYIQTKASAVFAVFPGVAPGSYLGAGLFPEPPLASRVEGLLARLGASYGPLAGGDWTALKAQAAAWNKAWVDLADQAGSRRGAVEAARDRWVAALGADAPSAPEIRSALTALTKDVGAWHDATQTKTNSTTDLPVLAASLATVATKAQGGNADQVRSALAAFQADWVKREALVRGVDPTLYSAVEVGVGTMRGQLASGDLAGTAALAHDLSQKLGALHAPQAFGAWDVGFLLMREGLEALLVLAALLTFLGRTNQQRRTPWVWAGAGAGLAASLAVAVVISVALGSWAASAPVMVEGLVGLTAVVLMLAMGGWLHGKSNVKAWNTWLKDSMGKAGGSGWALAALAFTAILREGAETVVFLWGLAGSLPLADLLAGLAGGLAVLVILGVVMLGFSKRLPLNWFFPVATGLIYFLAVKILGQSLGSLQSAGWLSSSPLGFGGPIDALGFNPTWETSIPQIVLFAVLATLLTRSIFKGHKKSPNSATPPAPAATHG